MKKTFSKFFATAAAVSMLASASAVVNADEALTFKTTSCEHGLIIEGVANADEYNDIAIPATIDGQNVVGIADFAFADLDNLTKIDTTAAVNLTAEHVNSYSFVTKYALLNDFIRIFGEDATEEEVLTVVANEVYGTKEVWTEEELADVKAKIGTKAELAGATLPEDLTDVVALTETAAVMLQNQEAMNLTPSTAEAVDIWETTITYEDVEVVYAEGSAIADIVVSLPVTVEPYPVLLGDANGDNKVNVRDAAFIASKLAQNKVEELPFENSDYNTDGKVNVRDAAALASDLAKGLVDVDAKG